MKKTMFAVLAGFLAIGAGAAQAQTAGAPPYVNSAPHTYVGIGVGAVKDTISDDHKRTTKIFGGYEFDQNWAVEAGYTYLGKTDFDFFSGDERLRGSMRSYTAYAAAKYTYPLTERSSVYGKLGLSHNTRKVKSDTPGWNLTDSDNGLYAAAGVQTRLTEKVSLYAEYERNGKRVINGSKNHVLNAGVKFDF